MITDNKNVIKYISYYCIVCVANMFASGTIIQTYLAHIGLQTWQIGIYTSLVSLMQSVAMFFSLWTADRIKNVKHTISACMYTMALFFVGVIFVSNLKSSFRIFVFPIMIFGCGIYFLSLGFRTIVDYRLPYQIINMRDYGKMMGVCGVTSSVVSVSASLGYSFFINSFEYSSVMMFFFVFCGVILLLAGKLVNSLKINDIYEKPQNNDVKVSKKIFKEKSLLYLAPAHFLRGVSNGIFGMTAIILVTNIGDDAAFTSGLVVVSSIAGIGAYSLYIWLIGKMKTTVFTAIGGLMMGAALVALLISRNIYVFYVFVIVAVVGMTFVDNSIPVFLSEFVSKEIIGSYTAVRMFLTMGGTATGSFLMGILMDNNISLPMIISIGIIPVLASLPFYLYDVLCVKRKVRN